MPEAGYTKRESVIYGFVADEVEGLPAGWECPDCGISRSSFEPMPV